MGKEIRTLNQCTMCGWELDTDHSVWDCPKCGSRRIEHQDYITCECGEEVCLNRFGSTTECESCGKFYNSFGQELAPVNEWDEEDRYGTFGPLNDPSDEDY